MRRARFVVLETFAGFFVREIYTDSSSCGYLFALGKVYLVDAYRDGLHYHTGACSRTASVDSRSAVEDLKALRAWKSGVPLAPRIYGRIAPDDMQPGLQVRLTRDQEDKLAQINPDGSFSFDGLEREQYRLVVQDTHGAQAHSIDLSETACSEAIVWFRGGWNIVASAPLDLRPAVPELPAPRQLPPEQPLH